MADVTSRGRAGTRAGSGSSTAWNGRCSVSSPLANACNTPNSRTIRRADVIHLTACGCQPSDNFSHEPPFRLRGRSYKRELPTERAESPGNKLEALCWRRLVNPKIVIWASIDAGADRHFNRGMAWQI